MRVVVSGAALLVAAAVSVSCAGSPAGTPSSSAVSEPSATAATRVPLTAPPLTAAPTTPRPLPPLPTPVVIDPCSLVTQDEVDAVGGTPLDPGIPAGEPSPYTCMWSGPVTGPVAQVEIYLGDNAKKILDIDRDTLEHEFTAVPEVADEAWLEENAIFFRKGTLWVAVRLVRLNDPAENVAALTQVAQRIADRLP